MLSDDDVRLARVTLMSIRHSIGVRARSRVCQHSEDSMRRRRAPKYSWESEQTKRGFASKGRIEQPTDRLARAASSNRKMYFTAVRGFKPSIVSKWLQTMSIHSYCFGAASRANMTSAACERESKGSQELLTISADTASCQRPIRIR